MKIQLRRYGWDGLQRVCEAASGNPTCKEARDLGKLLVTKFAIGVAAEIRKREIRGENLIDQMLVSIEIHLDPDPLLSPDESRRRRNLLVELDDIVTGKSWAPPQAD